MVHAIDQSDCEIPLCYSLICVRFFSRKRSRLQNTFLLILLSFIASMKSQSTFHFKLLSAKRRKIGIDDELGSISPITCAKEQESVAG